MKQQLNNSISSQSGFSLVTTLFIIVVLAVLGSYMALLGTTQGHSTALSVQGLRTWYAAISGFEWSAYRINATGNCPPVPTNMNIEGFSVTLSACVPYSITEGGGTYVLHDVTILSEMGSFGQADYVSRTLRATIGGP